MFVLFEFESIKFVLCFYLRDSEADQGPYAIILAPTRELAQQVSSICSTLEYASVSVSLDTFYTDLVLNPHDVCACRLRPKTKPLPTVSLNDHCDAYSSTVLHCYYLDCMVGSSEGQQLHVDCTEDELASVHEKALVMLYPTTVNANTNIFFVIYDATVFNT